MYHQRGSFEISDIEIERLNNGGDRIRKKSIILSTVLSIENCETYQFRIIGMENDIEYEMG